MNEHTPAQEYDAEARLTAFALGELDGDEAAEMARRVEADADLAREVEAIRAVGAQLEAALGAEPAPGLTDAQRETIGAGSVSGGGDAAADDTAADADADEDDRGPFIFTSRTVWAGIGLAAAACLTFVLVVPGLMDGTRRTESLSTWSGSESDDAIVRSAPSAEMSPAPASADELRSFIQFQSADDNASEQQVPLRDYARDPFTATSAETRELSRAAGVSAPVVADAAPADRRRGLAGGSSASPPASAAPVRKPRDASPLSGRGAGGAVTSESAAIGGRLRERRQAPAAASPPPGGGGIGGMAAGGGGGGGGLGGGSEGTDAYFAKTDRADGGAEDLRLVQIEREAALQAESYATIVENEFRNPVVDGKELPTFAVDVDTASYANLRRFITSGQMPPANAVRLEEMINYFRYDYAPPKGEHPFSVHVETSARPWNTTHRLVRIGLKGYEVAADMRPATNLVFLIDVSGSMNAPDKLPLVQESLRMLVRNLVADDRIAIVVYAGSSGLVLPSTYCDERGVIMNAIDNLRSGGSTNGGAGIELAYSVAREHYIEGGVNRVILCTDGDFNVGTTGDDALVQLVETKRETGVYLSALGFGTGNLKEAMMEKITNAGNGNFSYIDGLSEAKKVLVDEMTGTLVTIAKDVKVQVEFNPAKVASYRLLGYENRVMAAKDFYDDTKDAGEIGAGHTVTALFEIVPGHAGEALAAAQAAQAAGAAGAEPAGDPAAETTDADTDAGADADADEAIPAQEFLRDPEIVASEKLLNVRLRYKKPEQTKNDKATQIVHAAFDDGEGLESASTDFQFAAAAAALGMVLRDSKFKGDATYELVLDLATPGLADDDKGRRKEFVELVERAKALGGR